MVVNVAAAGRGLFLEPASRRNINLATDYGLNAVFAGGAVKINCAIKHAVISNGQGRESQLMGSLDEPIQTAGSIQQRILRVQMEVNKVRMRHSRKLPLPMRQQQGRDVHKANCSCLPEGVGGT